MPIENDTIESTETEVKNESSKDNLENQIDHKNSENEWVDLLGSGAIMKKIIKEGTPNTRPERQQMCSIGYELYIKEDKVIEKQEKLEIDLGDSDVVQGLDLAIALMNLGEICLLKIESRLAYGRKGLPPSIPPETTVTFKIELISAEDQEIELMTVAERKKKGNKKRERGNWWYGRGENQIAIQCYRRALDYLDEVEGGIKLPESENTEQITDTDLQSILEDRISIYNNLAAAQIKLESYEAALNSLKTVLLCQPNNIKALYRQAKVYKAKNDIPLAMKSLQKALDISPNDPDIKNEINKLKQLVDKQKKTERDLAKKMFGATLNEVKQTPLSKKVYLWATVVASVAVGLAGLATYRFKFA